MQRIPILTTLDGSAVIISLPADPGGYHYPQSEDKAAGAQVTLPRLVQLVSGGFGQALPPASCCNPRELGCSFHWHSAEVIQYDVDLELKNWHLRPGISGSEWSTLARVIYTSMNYTRSPCPVSPEWPSVLFSPPSSSLLASGVTLGEDHLLNGDPSPGVLGKVPVADVTPRGFWEQEAPGETRGPQTLLEWCLPIGLCRSSWCQMSSWAGSRVSCAPGQPWIGLGVIGLVLCLILS